MQCQLFETVVEYKKMSLGDKINKFHCEFDTWISILTFPSDQGSMLVFRGNAGDFQKSAFEIRVNTISPSFEVAAKNFED